MEKKVVKVNLDSNPSTPQLNISTIQEKRGGPCTKFLGIFYFFYILLQKPIISVLSLGSLIPVPSINARSQLTNFRIKGGTMTVDAGQLRMADIRIEEPMDEIIKPEHEQVIITKEVYSLELF